MAVTPLSSIPSDLYDLATQADSKAKGGNGDSQVSDVEVQNRMTAVKNAFPTNYASTDAYKRLTRLMTIVQSSTPAPTQPTGGGTTSSSGDTATLKEIARLMHVENDAIAALGTLAPYEAELARLQQALTTAQNSKGGWAGQKKQDKIDRIAKAQSDLDAFKAANTDNAQKKRDLEATRDSARAGYNQKIDQLAGAKNAPLISRRNELQTTEGSLSSAESRLEGQKKTLVIDSEYWIGFWGDVWTTSTNQRIVDLLNSVPRVKDALMDAATAVKSSKMELQNIDTSFPNFLWVSDLIPNPAKLYADYYLSASTKALINEVDALKKRAAEYQAKADAEVDPNKKKGYQSEVTKANNQIAAKQPLIDVDLRDATRSANEARSDVQDRIQGYTSGVVGKAASAISVIAQNRTKLNGKIGEYQGEINANRQAQIDAAKQYY